MCERTSEREYLLKIKEIEKQTVIECFLKIVNQYIKTVDY